MTMADFDTIKFYGVHSGLVIKRKVKIGLFKSKIVCQNADLFFYVKNGRSYEFFTKEDISDLFPPGGFGVCSTGYSLFHTTSGVWPFDAATFASHTKGYKGATPSEISAALADKRAEKRAREKAAAEAEAAKKAKAQADLDWLNRSI